MRIAYLIMAHINPRQVVRLISALPEDSPVFIHIDRRADQSMFDEVEAALGARPLTHFVCRHRCRWGGIGIARGTAELVHALNDSGYKFDYATLLSGSDYPIKSNAAIAGYLEANKGTEFIESFRADLPNRWTPHGAPYGLPDKMMRFHIQFRSLFLKQLWTRELPYGMLPHAGATWWTLTASSIVAISKFLRDHPKVMRFMKHAFIPDECVIQTVVGALPQHANINGNPLRMAIWDRPEPPYPAILRSSDIDAMAASGALFARKFDSNDDEVYAMIDTELRQAETVAVM